MISKACQYGIRAVIFIASRHDKGIKLNISQIAREVDAPEAFTAKILQLLNKHRIITSLKGPSGGFFIEKFQLEQSVINIVNAIDGTSVFKECILGLKQCSNSYPCPVHDEYKLAREALQNTFELFTIQHLALHVNEGNSYINNLLLNK
jgi:Rrf2 family protein